MDKKRLHDLLNHVAKGDLSVQKAIEKLGRLPFENIDYAHIDHHRSLRKGFPEVIFGEGKTESQIAGIMERMGEEEQIILVTRVSADKADAVCSRFPDAAYHADAKMIVWEKEAPAPIGRGTIMVISAGTSDIPVAREAVLTARAMGHRVDEVFDIGVAGIHRMFAHIERIREATVLIVVAGMEGALPSVVAGLVDKPVIAVPTSVGYGVSLGGLTALFGMLNSCSSNVAVVNIDNGFGAGYMAAAINRA